MRFEFVSFTIYKEKDTRAKGVTVCSQNFYNFNLSTSTNKFTAEMRTWLNLTRNNQIGLDKAKHILVWFCFVELQRFALVALFVVEITK